MRKFQICCTESLQFLDRMSILLFFFCIIDQIEESLPSEKNEPLGKTERKETDFFDNMHQEESASSTIGSSLFEKNEQATAVTTNGTKVAVGDVDVDDAEESDHTLRMTQIDRATTVKMSDNIDPNVGADILDSLLGLYIHLHEQPKSSLFFSFFPSLICRENTNPKKDENHKKWNCNKCKFTRSWYVVAIVICIIILIGAISGVIYK